MPSKNDLTAAPSVDINCDVGELLGDQGRQRDHLLMDHISSVSIACGRHAGDEESMRLSVIAARERGVAVGAHPGFPDRAGMGRRPFESDPLQVESLVREQIKLLWAIARENRARLAHVKPHGQLYNQAAESRAVAEAICRAVVGVDASLALFGLSNSQLLAAGDAAGLKTVSEAFADRNYQADGRLVPRDQPRAVLADCDLAVRRVIQMVRRGTVTAEDGTLIQVRAETVCVHGDHPGALELVRGLKTALLRAGIKIAPPRI